MSFYSLYRDCFFFFSKFQQRLSHDILTSVANSLLDGTVFQIVSGMAELQRMEEETLYNERNKLIASFSGRLTEKLASSFSLIVIVERRLLHLWCLCESIH